MHRDVAPALRSCWEKRFRRRGAIAYRVLEVILLQLAALRCKWTAGNLQLRLRSTTIVPSHDHDLLAVQHRPPTSPWRAGIAVWQLRGSSLIVMRFACSNRIGNWMVVDARESNGGGDGATTAGEQ